LIRHCFGGAAYDRPVFNLGPGEVLVLTLLGILFLGPRLPDLASRLRVDGAPPNVEPRPLLLRARRRRWRISDWLQVGVAIALGTAVVANAIARVIASR
jgi:hypothetical protein